MLEPGNDNPLAIRDARDRQRPFRVYGDFSDADLVAIVDLIRSAPVIPSPTGAMPPSTIFNHIRGSWPIRLISSETGEVEVEVQLIDESPLEKSGQGIRLRRVDGKWTVTKLTAWIAD